MARQVVHRSRRVFGVPHCADPHLPMRPSEGQEVAEFCDGCEADMQTAGEFEKAMRVEHGIAMQSGDKPNARRIPPQRFAVTVDVNLRQIFGHSRGPAEAEEVFVPPLQRLVDQRVYLRFQFPIPA